MTYCTEADLITRYGERELVQLTDTANRGVIDSERVERAIADAAATIDGYLQGRYTLPLASPPSVLERIACQLVRGYLHEDRAPKRVLELAADAEQFLIRVGRGEVRLGLASDNSTPASTGGPEFVMGQSVFDDAALKDY